MRRGGTVLAALLLFAACLWPGLAAAAPLAATATASRTAPAAAASATTPGDLAVAQLSGLNTDAISAFVDQIGATLGPGTGLSWKSLTTFMRGGALWHPDRLLPALAGLFAGELKASMGLLGQLLVLVVLAAVLRQIQGAFEAEAVARIADGVIFLALGAICLVGFSLAVALARTAIADLSSFMLALLPAMIGLAAASGAVTTAGLLHPAMTAAVTAVGVIVRAVVFPLALLAAVLDIVGAFSPTFKLSSLAALMRQISLGVLGLLFTVFLGVVAIEGAAGSVADGVALRTAKYAVKAFVPIVGGMLADTAELVLTSSMLLRSGLGLIGLISIGLLVAIPVLKMMALWAIYRVAAAVAQPVGGEAVAAVLGGVGSALVLLTLAVAIVGLMCFLSLAVLVGASGAALAGP